MNRKKTNHRTLRQLNIANRGYLVSTITVLALVVVAAVFFTVLSRSCIEKTRRERAEYAAKTISSRLMTMTECGFELLDTMLENKEIVNVGDLLSDIEFRDLSAIQTEHNLIKVKEHQYLAYNDGNLYLVVSGEDMHAVIGKIEAQHIREILDSAFSGSYGYALFDQKTGVFLVNELGLEGGNYFDCMLELNSTKAVKELLENSKTQFGISLPQGRFYIAQEIRDYCGIMLVIPEALVSGNFFDETAPMLPGLIGALILASAFIIWVALMLKRRRLAGAVYDKYLENWRRLSELLALRGDFLIFQMDNHGSKAGEILYYFNALSTSDGTELPVGIKTLEELETVLNVDASEMGKLSSIMSGMKTGDIVETELHCTLSTGVQCLRFELRCDNGVTGHIYACVYDCSDDERLRRTEISENEYVEDMRLRSEAIAHIDLSRNTWYLLYSRRQNSLTRLFGREVRYRAYDEDIRTLLEQSFEPEDYARFENSMTSDALRTAFLSGKNEFSNDYRINVSTSTAPKWYRVVVRIWRDAAGHDLKANVFLVDVNEQKKAEIERRERSEMLSRSLTAVGGIYFGMFYLDLISGICYAAKPYRGQPGDQLSVPYREMFSKYMQEFVHPEDREAWMKAIDAWTIRKLLVGNAHLMQLRYRSKLGDGYYWSLLSIQAAQIENGAVTHAVITFQRLHNVDATRCIAE